jgi:tetratricopeptide (TPR) repeat protein
VKANRALLVFVAVLTAIAGIAQEDEPDALAMYLRGDYDDAIRTTLNELEENPNNIESYVVLGWSLNAAGRYQDAVDYGLQALQVNQYESRIIRILATAYVGLGNDLQALDYLEDYVRLFPTGTDIDRVYASMAEIFIRFGEFHHADIALATALYHNDRDAGRWARLGYTREQLEQWQYAVEAYERALDLDPNLSAAARGLDRARAQL